MPSPGRRTSLAALAATAAAAAAIAAQAGARLATSLDAIEKYPGFFHGRAVAVAGTAVPADGTWRLPMTASRTLVLQPVDGTPPDRLVEYRGTLFDVGHLSSDDQRVSLFGLRDLVDRLADGHWPARGALFVLVNVSWADPPDARGSSIRAVALQPAAFEGRTVTLRGRFRGRNLFGDLPAWPRQGQWDFVLHSGDAAVWVAGQRPRGRGFDLDPASRRDSNRWLVVEGTVRVEGTLPVVDASAIALTTPVDDLEPGPAPLVLPPPPAPELIFSAPRNGETGIDPGVVVLLQFSRDMDAGTFEGRVTVTYDEAGTGDPPAHTVRYRPLNRGLEIRFGGPLAPGVTVVVSLSEGIAATDGQSIAPTSVRFTTGRPGRAGSR